MENVLITGTTSGIGKAFAEKFASMGNNIILVSRDRQKLEQQQLYLQNQYHVTVNFIAYDLSKEDAVDLIMEQIYNWNIPVDFLINNAEFGFVFGDFAWRYIIVSVGAALGISALFAFCKGKVCDCFACAVFGIDLCMYIQLNFMNGSLGLLDGNKNTVDMQRNWINLIIWIVLFILPFVAFRFFKKYRDRIVVFVCSALTMMQITGLVWLIVKSPQDAFVSSLSQYLLLGDDQFTVSADKNIIVLVIDTYSNSYVEEFFETYPEMAEVVKDFTYYNNADCHYEGSVLSLNYLISGTEWDMSVAIDEWCTTALDNERTDSFYSRLHDKNYIFNFIFCGYGLRGIIFQKTCNKCK